MMAVVLKVLLCAFLLIYAQYGVAAQEKESPQTEQCHCTNELEELEENLYSELAESKKEIDTLRADLNYWQNTTLSILKKYLLDKEAETSECDTEIINTSMLMDNHEGCNSTEEIVSQVKEVLDNYERTHSQELREIISEINSGRLPLGTFLNPASSCKHLPDNSSSGDYWIQNAGTGYASLEYCDMTRRCCDSSGGWMRVANLDMTNPTHHCPRGFRKISSPRRTCGRYGSGCYSTTYQVNGISYSRVCGRIKAYQYYSPDAFSPYFQDRSVTIDGVYVDGISVTHSQNPRKHIWTFVNAVDEIRSDTNSCPCIKTDTQFSGLVPPFIGGDYFCDTGSRYHFQELFYTEDPLWDGAGCSGSSTCCQFNNPPWFCKQLTESTTEDIELRLCGDQPISDEDIAIEQIEFYIQ